MTVEREFLPPAHLCPSLVGEACKAWRSKLQSSPNTCGKTGSYIDVFFHSEGQFFSKIAINLKSPRWSIEAWGVLPVLSARRWRLCCIHGWQRQRVVLARNPFVRRVAILQADTCGHCTRYISSFLKIIF